MGVVTLRFSTIKNCVIRSRVAMSLDEKFKAAADSVAALPKRPSDEELKEVYALYKQSTVGDINTQRPGMLDFKGKAKWNAWQSKKGMTQDDAKQAYITKADLLLSIYS